MLLARTLAQARARQYWLSLSLSGTSLMLSGYEAVGSAGQTVWVIDFYRALSGTVKGRRYCRDVTQKMSAACA